MKPNGSKNSKYGYGYFPTWAWFGVAWLQAAVFQCFFCLVKLNKNCGSILGCVSQKHCLLIMVVIPLNCIGNDGTCCFWETHPRAVLQNIEQLCFGQPKPEKHWQPIRIHLTLEQQTTESQYDTPYFGMDANIIIIRVIFIVIFLDVNGPCGFLH